MADEDPLIDVFSSTSGEDEDGPSNEPEIKAKRLKPQRTLKSRSSSSKIDLQKRCQLFNIHFLSRCDVDISASDCENGKVLASMSLMILMTTSKSRSRVQLHMLDINNNHFSETIMMVCISIVLSSKC